MTKRWEIVCSVHHDDVQQGEGMQEREMCRGQGIYSYSISHLANPCLHYHDSHNMPDPIEELFMPQLLKAHMSGDIVLLDIDGVVPGWGTYMFSLDVVQPEWNVSHLHLFILFYSSFPANRPSHQAPCSWDQHHVMYQFSWLYTSLTKLQRGSNRYCCCFWQQQKWTRWAETTACTN